MDLQRAREVLEGLADGVDPLTGEVLPDESVCNKAEVVRAFHCILNELQNKTKKKRLPENAGKPWTKEDDKALCRMFDEGKTRSEMCAFFKRTRGGILSRLAYLGKIPETELYYQMR